ncbi:hypothetical protein [Algibacter mikhailovii]|uniref:Long-chain fatty acid transport protein n=1 Tax=Algibacter mikhailovii TaxID=425498 RepID=A0A918R0A7_9FLAO|nr:hypothetical protein [Algibacter mikhailovii]GGZ78760.1 hypothetical protein GCM10007028_15260 [Algibacter mikhailovii]
MRSIQWFVFILFFALSIGYAQEGNYKFNNFGNRSILLAGNVTGSVSDLGLTYYNPSFLANSDNVGFSLNAKAYQLVNVKLTGPNQEGAQLSNTSFNSASTMAGGVFNLFNTRFAYSYLNKSNNNVNLNYSSNYLNDAILEQFPDAQDHNAKINLNSNLKDHWTGGSWAYKFNKNLSLGVSAFVSIYSYRGNSALSHVVQSTNNEVAYYQDVVGFNQKSYGLFLKLGANYKFPKFHLGLNINLPYLEVVSEGGFSYSKIVSGVGPQYNTYLDYSFDNLSAQRKEPLGISLGAGIPINRGKIHLNIDYVNGLSNYNKIDIPDIDIGTGELSPINFDESRKAVINFGIGAEYTLRDNLKAYGGLSTDFNAYDNSANIFDLAASENKPINIGEDFLHVSLGVDWKLKWLSIISGITYSNSESNFFSPYTIDFGDTSIDNEPNTELKYTRWQFVVGIDVPILNKKIKNFGIGQ